jgi:DNA-nicking Smr family endonuclease
MSRRRQISDEDHALWQAVTRTVSPLRRHRKDHAPAADQAVSKSKSKAPSLSRSATAAPKQHPKPVAKPFSKPVSKPAAPAGVTDSAPHLAPLDRRARQRLARGTHDIEARLDLHGRTQSEAHAALVRFLHRAQADGAKTVLVITGKGGAGSSGERGVLKRQVPLWLALPEFRGLVVGFGPAAIGHGGTGALYVRVRRRGR